MKNAKTQSPRSRRVPAPSPRRPRNTAALRKSFEDGVLWTFSSFIVMGSSKTDEFHTRARLSSQIQSALSGNAESEAAVRELLPMFARFAPSYPK